MCKLCEAQVVAVRKVACEAARKEIRAQFAAEGLGPENQEEDEEEKEGELPCASVEEVD